MLLWSALLPAVLPAAGGGSDSVAPLLQQPDDPLPLCTSCAQFCATPGVPGCTLPGPLAQQHIPAGTPRNFSVIRMTASPVRDLVNKNTGDAAGDLTFVLGELAESMYCRHLSLNGSRKAPECDGQNTPSWLNTQRLVYVQWQVEHDGIFAGYQECNLLNTSLDPTNASAWACANASSGVHIPGNSTDKDLCAEPVCASTLRARLGWEDRGADSGAWQPPPPPRSSNRPSTACTHAFAALCGGNTTQRGFTGCMECLRSEGAHGSALRRGPCTYREIANGLAVGTNASFCPRPAPLPQACVRDVAVRCGAFLPPSGTIAPSFTSANWSACHRCVDNWAKNATAHWNHKSKVGPCGLAPHQKAHDAPPSVLASAVIFGMCKGAPPPSAPPPLSNASWPGKGWLPNARLMRRLVQGSWFSTPAAGQCSGAQRPGQSGSGDCSWRAVRMERVVNYTCVNARVGAAVIARNPLCFRACATDGGEPSPNDPSDCWTRCFYNTLLGNSSFGDPGMQAVDVTTPFADAFKPEADGGCPELSRLKSDDSSAEALIGPVLIVADCSDAGTKGWTHTASNQLTQDGGKTCVTAVAPIQDADSLVMLPCGGSPHYNQNWSNHYWSHNLGHGQHAFVLPKHSDDADYPDPDHDVIWGEWPHPCPPISVLCPRSKVRPCTDFRPCTDLLQELPTKMSPRRSPTAARQC